MKIIVPVVSILLIVLIVLIYYFATKGTHKQRPIDKSNGTFDEPAKEALTTVEQKKEKTARDYIDRADIVRHNILEDDLRGPDRTAVALDIANDYMTGLIMLDELDPIAVDVTQRMRAMAQNNAAARDRHHDMIIDDDELELQRVLEQTMRAANIVENRKADTRMMESRRKARGAGGRAVASQIYLKDSVHYEDDRQNVHDSQVNADLRATFRTINDPHVNVDGCISELRDYLRVCNVMNDLDREHAMIALNKMAEGGKITALNTTEDYILASAWNRTKHPENTDNVTNLRESIAKALMQCYEGAGLVCANGRAGRVLNSLARLDFNEEVGNVGSFQMFKNEIIKESNDAMNREIKRLQREKPDAIHAWNNGDDVPEVAERLRNVIGECCDAYAGRLSSQSLKVIKDICIKAVE